MMLTLQFVHAVRDYSKKGVAKRLLLSMLFLSFLLEPVFGKYTYPITVADKIIAEYNRLENLNDKNSATGRFELNDFLIWIGDNDTWIEQRPAAASIEGIGFDYFKAILRDFNNNRKDKLRFYVVVVSDYSLQLLSSVNTSDFARSLGTYMMYNAHDVPTAATKIENWLKYNVDSLDWKTKLVALKKDVSDIPKEIAKNLDSRGFTDRIIYFYGILNFFSVQNKHQYISFDNILIEGTIKSKKDKLIEIAKTGMKQNDQDHGGYAIVGYYKAGLQIERAIKSITNSIKINVDTINVLLPNLSTLQEKRGLWINPDILSSSQLSVDNTRNILYADGNLYTYGNGQKVSYTQQQSSFVQAVVSALANIRSTTEGVEMLRALQNSPYGVTIYHSSFSPDANKRGSVFFDDDGNAANVISHYDQMIFYTQTLGSGGRLFWYPDRINPKPANFNPASYEPEAYSILAHELFHSWDAQRGYIDNRKFNQTPYPVYEARAMYFQDTLLKKMGEHPVIDFSQAIPAPTIHWLNK